MSFLNPFWAVIEPAVFNLYSRWSISDRGSLISISNGWEAGDRRLAGGGTNSYQVVRDDIPLSASADTYWETLDKEVSGFASTSGIANASAALSGGGIGTFLGYDANSASGPYYSDANKCYYNGSVTATITDTNTLPHEHVVRHWLKDGTYKVAVHDGAWFTVATGLTGLWNAAATRYVGIGASGGSGTGVYLNSGQRPFEYAVPSGANAGRFVTDLGELSEEILADSPWAYWRLGEAAGPTTFLDLSGNGHHFTVFSGVTAGVTGLVDGSTATDFSGSSAYISSTGGQYDVATLFNGNPDFTVMSVIRPDQITTVSALVHIGNLAVNGQQGWFFSTTATGGIHFQMIIQSFGFRTVTSPANLLAVGVTSMVHAVRKKDVASPTLAYGNLYHNGVAVTDGFGALHGNIGCANSSQNRIVLGSVNTNGAFSSPYDGKAQHMAIFPTALSPTRIAAHAAAAGL